MSIQIIVDSTADMTPAVAARVGIVPLTVHFGETEYVSGVDIDSRKFYEMLVETDVLPTTSQPTPFAFGEAFSAAVAEGHEVICITCSMLSMSCSGYRVFSSSRFSRYPSFSLAIGSLSFSLMRSTGRGNSRWT